MLPLVIQTSAYDIKAQTVNDHSLVMYIWLYILVPMHAGPSQLEMKVKSGGLMMAYSIYIYE